MRVAMLALVGTARTRGGIRFNDEDLPLDSFLDAGLVLGLSILVLLAHIGTNIEHPMNYHVDLGHFLLSTHLLTFTVSMNLRVKVLMRLSRIFTSDRLALGSFLMRSVSSLLCFSILYTIDSEKLNILVVTYYFIPLLPILINVSVVMLIYIKL